MNFRRWITALAVLSLFVGLASAQVTGPGTANGSSLQCTATVAVPPQLRAEAMTELIGDIVITCSGGSLVATPGTPIPTANITISLLTNVTSRLIENTNTSEALLMIDEPGAPGSVVPPVAGYGPAAAQKPCNSPTTAPLFGAGIGGCPQYGYTTASGTNVMSSTSALAAAPATSDAANMYLGNVSGNQVTFQGIPILPPASANIVRVYRITNIRANISALASGQPGTTALQANISISGNTSLPINNPIVTAGFIQNGLTTNVRKASDNTANLSSSGLGFNQCNSKTLASVAILQFNENFGTAFKTRVAPDANYNGQGIGTDQHVPGNIYNSESGFVIPGVTNQLGILAGGNAGLADYGTRLKAVFNNVPSGVRIFVTTSNLNGPASSGSTVNKAPAGTDITTFAQMVVSETAPDGNGTAPVVIPTGTINTGAIQYAEVTLSGGSGSAVWEVINTNPAALESVNFGVYTTFSANPANNLPTPNQTATVNLSYAPTPPIPFSVSGGGAASGTLTIPRFADTSTAKNLLVINICQTVLLFPYVTNQAGFDTGLAIANTSQDPLGTGTQAGTCALTWYDGTGKTAPTPAFNVAPGTVYANLTSVLAPGFQGYMFAVCNFQYAHGFAFISDLGARNLAMGYLALIVDNGDRTAVARGPAGETLAH